MSQLLETAKIEDSQYNFGSHLMLDCYGCPKEKLADMDIIFGVLDTLPEKIGLIKSMPPYVFKYQGKEESEWGLSGFVLIAEAHISIHTFPDEGHVFIDIFSGKEFDVDFALDELAKEFEAERHEHDFTTVFKHREPLSRLS